MVPDYFIEYVFAFYCCFFYHGFFPFGDLYHDSHVFSMFILLLFTLKNANSYAFKLYINICCYLLCYFATVATSQLVKIFFRLQGEKFLRFFAKQKKLPCKNFILNT